MNAIILAAGLGSRFKEMTKNNHKALLPINGTPNIERTIQLLLEATITEIHIVTGYRAESFQYLTKKYPTISLHYNEKFSEYNNIYSFIQALNFFGDSFVIDADTVFTSNLFTEKPVTSQYFTMIREERGIEWCPVVNREGRVIEMKISAEKLPAMTGLSYWSKIDAEKIKKAIPPFLTIEKLSDSKLYWDDIPLSVLDDLNLGTKEIPLNTLFEMDTQENYLFINKKIDNKDIIE